MPAGPSSIVQQPTLPIVLRQHRDRISGTERPSPGQWVYVLPISPAADPIDLVPADPLAPTFQNGWGNSPTGQPVSFRIHPATRVALRGSPVGGTIPSVVFTLPEAFRPQSAAPVTFPSQDGSSVFTGIVQASGDVWIFNQIATDLACDTENTCGWLSFEATAFDPASSVSINFKIHPSEGPLQITNVDDPAEAYAWGNGVNWNTDGNPVDFETGAFTLNASGAVNINTVAKSSEQINLTSDDALNLTANGSAGGILSATGPTGDEFLMEVNEVVLLLRTGSKFEIQDNSGSPLLRVGENGTDYEIRTGQTWVADL